MTPTLYRTLKDILKIICLGLLASSREFPYEDLGARGDLAEEKYLQSVFSRIKV